MISSPNSRNNIKVSIIIPLYNGEKTIKKTIESCLKQTYQSIEIIITDDHSSDNSLNIVKKVATSDFRIKILEHKNSQGLCKNSNKAASNVKGEFLLFLGQDDLLETIHIEEMLKYFDSSISMVYCNCLLIDENDNIIGKNDLDYREVYYRDFVRKNAIQSCGAIIRKSAFEKVGGYPEFDKYPNYGEWYLWVKLLSTGRIIQCTSVRSLYRRHNSNISNSFNQKKYIIGLNKYWNKCRKLALGKAEFSIFKRFIEHTYILARTIRVYIRYVIVCIIKE